MNRFTGVEVADVPSIHWGRLLALCFSESRPVVQVMFMLRFACGAALVSPHVAPDAGGWWRCLAAALGWFLASVHAYLLNGVEDVVEDVVNGAGRPIARGDLDPERAREVARWCAVVALVAAAGAGLPLFLLTAGYLVLGRLYSVPPVRLGATVVGGLVVVLTATSATYVAGGLAVGGLPTGDGLLFTIVAVLWTTLVGGIAKDLSDLEGDLAGGRRTLATRTPAILLRGGLAVVALALGTTLWAGSAGSPSLRLPGALLFIGAVAVALLLVTTRGATDRTVSRRPYRAFMLTQLAAHCAVLPMSVLAS